MWHKTLKIYIFRAMTTKFDNFTLFTVRSPTYILMVLITSLTVNNLFRYNKRWNSENKNQKETPLSPLLFNFSAYKKYNVVSYCDIISFQLWMWFPSLPSTRILSTMKSFFFWRDFFKISANPNLSKYYFIISSYSEMKYDVWLLCYRNSNMCKNSFTLKMILKFPLKFTHLKQFLVSK